MTETLKQEEREMGGKLWDLVCQVIESSRNPLDVIREQLSNCCAKEVEASDVRVIFYDDPTYRASFIIQDNGCGMDLTNDPKKPGRLDKFLDVAVSAHAGVRTDEFGYKGLGAKLAMNCARLEIRTRSKDTGKSYFVYVDDPIKDLRNNLPPQYKVVEGGGPTNAGTEVKIFGYSGGVTTNLFKFDRIRKYLFFNTLVGHTNERTMPKITLRTPEKEEVLITGFPFLVNPDEANWKTYVIQDPIIVDKKGKNDERIRVILKGGFTLETGDEKITSGYTLSGDRAGLFLSIKGIPYVRLDLNQFRSSFSTLQYKFCRFVTECDDLSNHMDFARGYYRENETTLLFESALRDCFDKLAEHQGYKTFLKERERDRTIRQRESLDARKQALQSSGQKFVYLKTDDRRIHRVPDNEKDTLALLWKLEALRALPFDFFETLEHTNLEGIDVLANVRAEKDGQTQYFVPIEVEDIFEEYIPHGHNPKQTAMIICWEIEDPEVLEKSEDKRYLFFFKLGDERIPVYEIRSLPSIDIK
jgi:hypothetical protein